MPRETPFKHHRSPIAVILCAMRWYLRYPLSYQDITDLMAEHGISVDPTVAAKGETDGYAFVGSFKTFYNLSKQVQTTPGLRFDPLATLNALYGELEGFTETNAGILDLTLSDTSSDQVVTGLGIGFDRAVGTTQVSLEGRFA